MSLSCAFATGHPGASAELFGHPVEVLTFWVAVLALVGVGATAVVYFKQLQAMKRQVEITGEQLVVAQQALQAPLFLEAMNLLQDAEMRRLRGELAAMEVRDVTDAHYLDVAERVGEAYQRVGFLARNGLISADLVVKNWSRSIVDCFGWIRPMLVYRQADEARASLFGDFEWLAGQAAAASAREGQPS